MRRFTPILILLLVTLLFSAVPARAFWFGGDDTLVTIDGTRYRAADFKLWWQFWKDEKQALPESPDFYVDWLLLAREAEQMELGADPGFRRQTEVFLKSRALLMLKYDEVNSRINITEADLQAYYDSSYQPRWLVQRLEFNDAAAAAAAWQELAAGTVTFDELAARPLEQGGPKLNRENWLRPKAIDPGWAAIFVKLEVGAVVDPAEHEQGPGLFRLKERKAGDAEDFAKLHDELQRELWKKQENDLTLALLESLREKYQVTVDYERIDAIDLTAAEDTFGDDLVITTSKQSVTERDFVIIANRHLASRAASAHALTDPEDTRKLKREITGGIIAQNVTDWGALDRHYENDPRFKDEFDFHVRHRLVLALEQRLFLPNAKVSAEEIKRHYEENLERYTQPAMVKVVILDDTQGPVAQVLADVLVGVPFSKAMVDRLERRIPPQDIPVNHLDPEVRAAVDKLTVGETSPLFTAQGSQVLVHLQERTPAMPLPLERVTESIRSRLSREKIDQQRRDYLDLLKKRSRIEIRSRQWKAIQKELGGA